mgnify:FL=1
MTDQRRHKLLLLDGSAVLFRSFYATAPYGQYMYNDEGIPTNAVNGFLRHLFLAVSHFKPTHLAVCWDTGEKTFRHELYPDYKGNRAEPPEELVPQFLLARKALEALAVPSIAKSGYEADDCLGTIASRVKEEAEVYILTGDHDLLQVLDDHVYVVLLKKGMGNYEVVSKDQFITERGYTPVHYIDIKAFPGDASDHYPGVYGIGPKTAKKLIREYGSVSGVLKNLHQLTPSQRKKIEKEREHLILSGKLAEIHCRVPVTFNLEDAKIQFQDAHFRERLKQLNIRGMTRILSLVEDQAPLGPVI